MYVITGSVSIHLNTKNLQTMIIYFRTLSTHCTLEKINTPGLGTYKEAQVFLDTGVRKLSWKKLEESNITFDLVQIMSSWISLYHQDLDKVLDQKLTWEYNFIILYKNRKIMLELEKNGGLKMVAHIVICHRDCIYLFSQFVFKSVPHLASNWGWLFFI